MGQGDNFCSGGCVRLQKIKSHSVTTCHQSLFCYSVLSCSLVFSISSSFSCLLFLFLLRLLKLTRAAKGRTFGEGKHDGLCKQSGPQEAEILSNKISFFINFDGVYFLTNTPHLLDEKRVILDSCLLSPLLHQAQLFFLQLPPKAAKIESKLGFFQVSVLPVNSMLSQCGASK